MAFDELKTPKRSNPLKTVGVSAAYHMVGTSGSHRLVIFFSREAAAGMGVGRGDTLAVHEGRDDDACHLQLVKTDGHGYTVGTSGGKNSDTLRITITARALRHHVIKADASIPSSEMAYQVFNRRLTVLIPFLTPKE